MTAHERANRLERAARLALAILAHRASDAPSRFGADEFASDLDSEQWTLFAAVAGIGHAPSEHTRTECIRLLGEYEAMHAAAEQVAS